MTESERLLNQNSAPLRRWIGVCALVMIFALLGQFALAFHQFGWGVEGLRGLFAGNSPFGGSPPIALWPYQIAGAWGIPPLVWLFARWTYHWPAAIRSAKQQGFPVEFLPLLFKVISSGFAFFGLRFLFLFAHALNSR